jgi:hypothetical protein
MRIRSDPNTFPIAVLLLSFLIVSAFAEAAQTRKIERLALHEAKILVSLTSAARAAMGRGDKIDWFASESENWFYFEARNISPYERWMQTARETSDDPPNAPLIGHFAVNRQTAEVWDSVLEKLIETPELLYIQRLLREVHGCDEQCLEQSKNRSYWEERDSSKSLDNWFSSW